MANYQPKTDHLPKLSTQRKEACTAQYTLRIPPSTKNKLRKVEDLNEKVRGFLESLAEEIPA